MGLASKLGWTNHKILRECKWLGKDCVQRWAARGRAGWDCADDAERTGCPLKITGPKARQLRCALMNKRFVTPARLAAKFDVDPRTIRNTAHRLGKMTKY